jgi:hypothetical protein
MQSQLLVPTWMRALSLNDPAANGMRCAFTVACPITDPLGLLAASDRNDHGPNGELSQQPRYGVYISISASFQCAGAYDGWPARTVQALAELGFASEARALLEAVAPVLLEGPFGQVPAAMSSR